MSIDYLILRKLVGLKSLQWIRGDGVSNISSIFPVISILALKHNSTGHKPEQSLGDSGGRWSPACCSLWCREESDTTEWLNNNTQQHEDVKEEEQSALDHAMS